MRFVRLAAVVAILFLVAPPVSAASKTYAVSIPGTYFTPQSIRIHVGDTVRWTNTSHDGHSVTSDPNSPESFSSSSNCPGNFLFNDCIRPNRSYEHTFMTRGTYIYRDNNDGHPGPYPHCGMCGRVVVLRKPSPTASPSASTSASSSPSISPSPTGSATSSGSPSPGSSTLASGPAGSKGGTPTLAIAAVGVALLAGTGVIVYRTLIRRA